MSLVERAAVRGRRLARGAFLTLILTATGVYAGGGPRNVLVVKNTRSQTSIAICNYYVQARQIPPENVCPINCATEENVSKIECETNIIAPIRAYLQTPEMANRIDYIVMTKGAPLAANYGYSSGYLSIASILTCVGEPSVTSPRTNPYGPTAWPAAPETAFSHQLVFSGKRYYLVTRLDAYTTADVFTMIDRSIIASSGGTVALDRMVVSSPPPYVTMNNRLTDARDILQAKGIPVMYDDTTTFMGNLTGLIGYFSWGSNDPYYNKTAYTSNSFLPGSVADTYVSTSGRTFNPTTGGQSLIADLIPLGACGLHGYVSEPYTAYATWPNTLFDRYTKGYNLAESFYAACPQLFWKSVVIGDPLMSVYQSPPLVSLSETLEPLTGIATITATASDSSGISKVDFYFEGAYLGTDTEAPYTATVDTTQYTVGAHKVEAIAYENSPVATQGSVVANLLVENDISNLSVIADAFPSPDGQGVRATAKAVIAGTADMGGGEFYIAEENRSSGVRVISTEPVVEGDLVTALGEMVTDAGERSILANSVSVVDHLLTPLKPVALSNMALGGGDVNEHTLGVTGGHGARNLGLLVRTMGKVTYVGSAGEDYFYISDGGSANDGSGRVGVKIKSRDLAKPAIGSVVMVTGVCASEQSGNQRTRVIKPRRQADIQLLRDP